MFIVYIPTHFNNTFKASFSNKKHSKTHYKKYKTFFILFKKWG